MPRMTEGELEKYSPEEREYFRNETEEQLEAREWGSLSYVLKDCRGQKETHRRLSVKYTKWGVRLGLSVTILTALVSTSIFASILRNTSNIYLQTGAAVISLLASILSATNNFMRLHPEAVRHYHARLQYSALERKINDFLDEYGHRVVQGTPKFRSQARASLKAIYAEFEKIRESAPIVE